MSKDFDTEEDLHFFAQPYLFEPEYTDEELRAMEEAPTQQQLLSQASERQRAMETWWCKLPYDAYRTGELVLHQVGHRYRLSALLSRSVLDVFFHLPKVNWKRRPRPEGPGGTLTVDQCRLVAYRVVLEWILKGEKLGRHNRKVLPSCVVRSIRERYPSSSATYVGFKEAEEAFGLI
ncbi:hypothetical protein ABG768_020638 [Culter alburnus]|uniref:P2X purinoreceptor 7 intracellular domain-containing protein n=1 Tax=Culter alburnus TaxID=194366 RepID=A0AAW2AYS8_CULAL